MALRGARELAPCLTTSRRRTLQSVAADSKEFLTLLQREPLAATHKKSSGLRRIERSAVAKSRSPHAESDACRSIHADL